MGSHAANDDQRIPMKNEPSVTSESSKIDPPGSRPPIHVVPPSVEDRVEGTDPAGDEALEAVAASLSHVASVMDHLTVQLTQLTDTFGRTRAARMTEAEIGQLFVRAQVHVDESVRRADARAHQIVTGAQADAEQTVTVARSRSDAILAAARAQASQIVTGAQAQAARLIEEASTEADRIVAEAKRRAILHPEAVERLSSTIETFARMNSELVGELSMLRSSMVPAAKATTGATPSSPAVAVPAAQTDPAPAPPPLRQNEQAHGTRTAIPGVVEPHPTYPPPPPPQTPGDTDRRSS
jgi:cell division septum initiation protein DivIVA